jgi:hypothetical protein
MINRDAVSADSSRPRIETDLFITQTPELRFPLGGTAPEVCDCRPRGL